MVQRPRSILSKTVPKVVEVVEVFVVNLSVEKISIDFVQRLSLNVLLHFIVVHNKTAADVGYEGICNDEAELFVSVN